MTARAIRRIQYVITCDRCSLSRITEDGVLAERLVEEHDAECWPLPFQGGDPAPYRTRSKR